VYGIAASLAATDVLAAKLAPVGVRATVLNSTQFLDGVNRPATDRHRLVIQPGSLWLTDEASLLAAGHAAGVKQLAATDGKEIPAGDLEQPQTPTEGDAMGGDGRSVRINQSRSSSPARMLFRKACQQGSEVVSNCPLPAFRESRMYTVPSVVATSTQLVPPEKVLRRQVRKP
jgi:hypothetical protein